MPTTKPERVGQRVGIVKRLLLRSATFVRAARKFVKRESAAVGDIEAALELMSADAFQPSLKAHKLKGDLEGSWACSAGYDLRIVFRFVEHEGREAILLATVGTHEEVY
jgi:mRNA interferase YafQ